jgi:hypothetical protein
MSTLGFLLAISVPLAVFVWAVCWPAPTPPREPSDPAGRRTEDDAD